MFMIAGLLMLTAAGDDDKLQKAKKMVRWVAIGLVVALLSWAIVTLVVAKWPVGPTGIITK